MGTAYPRGLDNFNNPAQGQSRSAPGVEEWLLFSDLNDAVEAIEAALGATPYGPYANVGNYLAVLGAGGSSVPIDDTLSTFNTDPVVLSRELTVDYGGGYIENTNYHLYYDGKQVTALTASDEPGTKTNTIYLGYGIGLTSTNDSSPGGEASISIIPGAGSGAFTGIHAPYVALHSNTRQLTVGNDIVGTNYRINDNHGNASFLADVGGLTLTMNDLSAPQFTLQDSTLAPVVEVAAFDGDGNWYFRVGGQSGAGNATFDIYREKDGVGQGINLIGINLAATTSAAAHFGIGSDLLDDHSLISASMHVYSVTEGGDLGSVFTYATATSLMAQIAISEFPGQTAPYLIMGPNGSPTYTFSPGGLFNFGLIDLVDFYNDGSRFFRMGGPTHTPGSPAINFYRDTVSTYAADIEGSTVHNGNVARSAFAAGADMELDGTYAIGSFSVSATNLAGKHGQVGIMANSENLTAQVYAYGVEGQTTPLLNLKDGANADVFIITPTEIGFFGAAPVAKPTGVAVTAAGIHAALVTLNLIAA